MNAGQVATLVAEEVDALRYKPLWTFRFDLMHDRLYVSRLEPNSDTGPHDSDTWLDPNQWVKIGQSYAVPPTLVFVASCDGEDVRGEVRRWLRKVIHECETHEADEHIWFGDERPFRPRHAR